LKYENTQKAFEQPKKLVDFGPNIAIVARTRCPVFLLYSENKSVPQGPNHTQDKTGE
jgi:hypothetical protein